jgi:periplasmic protein TonB
MPHALLLSPDDQAVSAITGVLEEMSVTCERPLDGASAAQKINSHSFDLVLVDCENLPAAKLIFDVCRRGKSGNNPVPIAIVDGRAGLPTAFRLGAELILTKPVAKDQARSTIRTAVGRVRKDVQTNESGPPQPASAATSSAAPSSAAPTAERALAAAAAAGSSQLTSFADPAPSFVPAAAPGVAPSVALSVAPTEALAASLPAPAIATKMHSVVDVDATPATPKLNPQSASFSESSAPAVSVNSKAARPLGPSDDPVLAELEESELAESQRKSSGPAKAAPDQPAAKSDASAFSSRPLGGQKTRRSLGALLMLVLAGGGFYAVWTYQPGFRAIAQPQIDRALALAGMALPPTPAPSPTKRPPQLAPAPTAAPAPASPTDQNKTPATAPDSATGSPTASTAAPVAAKPEASKPSETKPGDSKEDVTVATSSGAELPGESSAIVLSAKGAEQRLAYSVAPKYPVEARSGAAEGTVVLKEVVDENGKVEGVRLVEGNAVLATAAINAVKQWRYRPYVREGKAQPFQTVVLVDFQRP